MKSERRHELQHNELAEWLFKSGERLKPYQNLILAGVAVAVVAVAAYSWWSRTSATRASQAWTDLSRSLDAGSPDMITTVAEDYPNTVVGQTATVILGDWRLAMACNQRFVSMALAQKQLDDAIDSYSKVLETSRLPSLLERATYGMARANETRGELEDATRYYKEVTEKWPDGAYAAAAKQRLDDFQQLDTKRMFGDLRKFEPKPAFSEEPGALGPLPSFSEPLPQEPPVAPAAPPKTDLNKKSNADNNTEEQKKK
jgi:tetratricopeptide (TPR) repeat protein